MREIIKWFGQSHRWQHLVGGILIGWFAMGIYTALYAVIGVASALEMKDKSWGGVWDWIDWSLTVGGGCIGMGLWQLIMAML